MERREFIKQMGLGLAGGWVLGRLSWPWPAWAAGPELRLALLADAHLKDGNAQRGEATALARAVAEICELEPPPDLVLFAGDLAHRGRPDALDLGREILSDLPGPVWAVRGEGDHSPGGYSAWVRRFGAPRFSMAYRGAQVIGLDPALRRTSRGPVFEMGAPQRQWLARELAKLTPAAPLVIVSHAPLARLFHPWQQWTGDAPEVIRLLRHFPRVLCLHGHVHGLETGVRGQGSGANYAENSITHFGLPATAWPLPQAMQGTPAFRRPGLGPRGCGWALATLSPTTRHFQPYLWQA
jgi:3',5'-cyclic-AMP phosphodiesterase